MLSSKCDSKKINYPFNCYSGGRHLNAISHSKTLSMLEKHFMLTIGSLIDFRDFENSAYYISVKKLAELMSCGERTILKLVRSLNDKKYLVVENRFDENKRQMSNLYALSPLIFEEYATLWSASRAGGRVHDVQTVTPLEELPQEEKIISKDIIKKTPKRTKASDLKRTVGYLSAMFKPDGTPETKGFPWPNREQITVVAETLLDVYTVEHIKGWFDHFSAQGGLGKMRWTPAEFIKGIKQFHEDPAIIAPLEPLEDLTNMLEAMDRETERIAELQKKEKL